MLALLSGLYLFLNTFLMSLVVGARSKYGVKHPIMYPSETDVSRRRVPRALARAISQAARRLLGQEQRRSCGVLERRARPRELPRVERAAVLRHSRQLARREELLDRVRARHDQLSGARPVWRRVFDRHRSARTWLRREPPRDVGAPWHTLHVHCKVVETFVIKTNVRMSFIRELTQ